MPSDHPPYTASIHHDGSSRYVQPAHKTGLRLGDEVTLRLRTGMDVPVEHIFLRTCPDGEQHFVDMQPEPPGQGAPCRWWQARLRLSMPRVAYRFLLFTPDGAWWYNGRGLHRHAPTDADDFRLLVDYAAPDWAPASVFYQIFPDRFADGDPGNNVRDGEFTYWGLPARARHWGEPPAQGGREALVEFFGGDLAGIEAHLDYLEDLGVNALYLNPIFSAYSNHRYDVTDYYNVDPHLGGNPALVSLRRATQARGVRFILDIVPNHCGILHPWFMAAQADIHAPTAEYFTFKDHPGDYECWLGVRSLPKLNYRSEDLRKVMYASPEGVFRHWLRPPYAADGWRIDVANMLARQGADQLGEEVGRGIRQAVKAENPQAYLLGENFFDGSHQLQGDCWDATMNYAGFSQPLWYWLARFEVYHPGQRRRISTPGPWSTQALVDTWAAYRAAIPWVIARQQYNLLGSHDTQRILTLLGGDAALNRIAVGILMTYVGVPSVYYGDEVGLDSGEYGFRQCMPWERAAWDQDLRGYYQALIHLRRTSSALIEGGFQVLLVEENTLAYQRDSHDECVLVVAHRGPGGRPASPIPVAHGAIPDGTEFVELFGGGRARVEAGHLPLPALSPGASIWRARD